MNTVEQIENQLNRLEWDGCCGFTVVVADGNLPLGWVRLADDWVEIIGPASEILQALQDTPDGATYCTGPIEDINYELRFASDWPKELIHVESPPPEEENEASLLILVTNAGLRFIVGIHNESNDAFYNADGLWFDSIIKAINYYERLANV
jgi:hypothetical protein